MKLYYLMMITALTASSVAGAADTSERASPVDRNSSCMDRNVDASSGNCVVKDDGTPRHTYPPRPAALTTAPTSVPQAAPAASTVRKSSAASK